MTFVRKATQAAAVAGAGAVGVLAMGILLSLRFRLTPATYEMLMAEIEHLRAGDGHVPDPEARRVVEDLSGWRYDQ